MRVLLIEDDTATAQSIELMLKSEGFNVYTTDLGEEGVDLGKLYDYDIILLDLNLPDMSGYEVLKTLRVSKVNTPILILSGLAGIEDDDGAVVVDQHLRTTSPRVFAAGDVTLAPQFVYVAAYQGGLAAENALNGVRKPVDLTALPGVIFTDPQVATVGLTEEQARADGFDVKTSVLPLTAVPRAQVNYEEVGVFKLVADAVTDRVLGAHVVAGNAGDVIYAATLAVKHRLTVADLVESFAPYLTMTEGLKLGALAFDRDVTKLSCCAA